MNNELRILGNVNNVTGLITTLIQTSSDNETTYNISVVSVTMVSHNLYLAVYDCEPKAGIRLNPVRRVAQIDTAKCYIPWTNIVSYDTGTVPAVLAF